MRRGFCFLRSGLEIRPVRSRYAERQQGVDHESFFTTRFFKGIKMKSRMLFLISGFFLASGCAPAQTANKPGAPGAFGTPAARIISLAPSNTEILFALGAGAQVVGRDDHSDYPADAKTIASIGSTFGKINAEAVVSLKPDLVLAAGTTTPEQIQTLTDLGLMVYRVDNPKDFDGLYSNLYIVGALTGRGKEAAALANALRQRVSAVEGKVAGAAAPTVFYEMDATEPAKPWTAGPGSFVDMLVTKAGGKNIGGSLLTQEWAQLSAEEIIVQNPEIILLGSASYGTTLESVKQRAGWQKIAAVRNNAVYPVDDIIVTRPGPRLVDALEMLAKLLHPDLFR
jgi:iron complex transport system substrate-binding protein